RLFSSDMADAWRAMVIRRRRWKIYSCILSRKARPIPAGGSARATRMPLLPPSRPRRPTAPPQRASRKANRPGSFIPFFILELSYAGFSGHRTRTAALAKLSRGPGDMDAHPGRLLRGCPGCLADCELAAQLREHSAAAAELPGTSLRLGVGHPCLLRRRQSFPNQVAGRTDDPFPLARARHVCRVCGVGRAHGADGP